MATPIAPGAAPKDAPIHPKTLHAITPQDRAMVGLPPHGTKPGLGGWQPFWDPLAALFPKHTGREAWKMETEAAGYN